MKKIPDNAKKVFEGEIFDVYQWPQELFDGSLATFEAVKRRDTVTVVATVDDKIVLNNEEQPNRDPFIALPGGVSEDGVSLLLNAKRELLEETGYATEDWQEWFISDVLGNHKIEWNNYFYIARDCQKIAEKKLDPGEKIENILLTFEEFLELKNNPKIRNKDLIPILEKATSSEEEKEKLKKLLFATN